MERLNKILILCGMGFGSSFIVRENVRKVVEEMGLEDVEVEHSDIGSASQGSADLFICGTDLEESCERYGPVVSLSNLFDMDELREKLGAYLKDQGIV
ncbi:MAG: PTS sugar transporter subunit IIB [Bacillota bacterium]